MGNPVNIDIQAMMVIEILHDYAGCSRDDVESMVELAIANNKDNQLFYLRQMIEDYMANLQLNVPEVLN